MTTSPPRRIWPWLLLIALLAVGAFAWHTLRPPDMTQVLRANLEGVGHMERFKYPEAAAAFERVHELAPDWTPGKINLGIALYNLARGQAEPKEREASQNRAIALFRDVLTREKDNPYAHYGLGLIYLHNLGKYEEAEPFFRRVTEIDPDDAVAWYWLGATLLDEPDKAAECFAKALERDPNLRAALNNHMQHLRGAGRDADADALLKRFQDLERANWFTPLDPQYNTDLGKYALVIGRPDIPRPKNAGPPRLPSLVTSDTFKVALRPGAAWKKEPDTRTPLGKLRNLFGVVLVALDFDRDNKPDLFLIDAIDDEKRGSNALLRNEGNGRFTDVTVEAGLASIRDALGAIAADYDNDGLTDLLVTTATGVRLFRNTGKGAFEDVTKAAGLDKLTGVCLGAAFVDLDQDGDLDLLIAQCAASADKLDGPPDGRVVAFLNVGEAPAVNVNADPPPLKTAFRPLENKELTGPPTRPVGFAVADFDGDGDLDIAVVDRAGSTQIIVNDRLLAFRRTTIDECAANAALALDVDRDSRPELFVLGRETSARRFATDRREKDGLKYWLNVAAEAPPLTQAHAVDFDLDGATDVLGLMAVVPGESRLVLLHNHDGRLTADAPFSYPADGAAAGLAVADFDGDGIPDVLTFSYGEGLRLLHNEGVGNHVLTLLPSGHRRVEPSGSSVRCNADGFGVRVLAQTGSFLSVAENTTRSAGLGQSSLPLTLGMGPHSEVELLRLRWPDFCWQAELHVAADLPKERNFKVLKLDESNRKTVSCPILFTWDGRRFAFVTDFLGAGTLGESLAGGGHRPPRPEESVKIEPEQLAPRDGHFVLKVAEPMDEVTYLDRLRLDVVDHPADVRVYPDERFSSGGTPPTQDVIAFREAILPETARDHRGRDVTAALAARDRVTVDGFARRTWIGIAEEHFVELDFGARLSRFGPKERLVLCLAGWTDYPYPESIWAAGQAGVEVLAPVLERRSDDGRWVKVADAGFPAGLPRVMTLDVTGLVTGPRCALRLRTNMHVFWDQILIAPALGEAPRTTPLDVADAVLSYRGCMKEYSPDGREPTLYDYDRLEVVPVARPAGKLTRFGDVTELLRTTDDRFAIFGPGDELTVRFDATPLPPLPEGWKRSFVLRTWGYCKDCSPFTDSGATVEPLPFRAMIDYPYGPKEKHPDEDYQRRWNTRQVKPKR